MCGRFSQKGLQTVLRPSVDALTWYVIMSSAVASSLISSHNSCTAPIMTSYVCSGKHSELLVSFLVALVTREASYGVIVTRTQ